MGGKEQGGMIRQKDGKREEGGEVQEPLPSSLVAITTPSSFFVVVDKTEHLKEGEGQRGAVVQDGVGEGGHHLPSSLVAMTTPSSFSAVVNRYD